MIASPTLQAEGARAPRDPHSLLTTAAGPHRETLGVAERHRLGAFLDFAHEQYLATLDCALCANHIDLVALRDHVFLLCLVPRWAEREFQRLVGSLEHDMHALIGAWLQVFDGALDGRLRCHAVIGGPAAPASLRRNSGSEHDCQRGDTQ